MYMLKELVHPKVNLDTYINGKWVPARPLDGPFVWRLKDAWEVLMGRADAFTWPEGQ